MLPITSIVNKNKCRYGRGKKLRLIVSCCQDLLRDRYDLRPTAGWCNNDQSANTLVRKLELALHYKIAKQCNQFVTARHGSTVTLSSSSPSAAIAVATSELGCIPRYVAPDTGVQFE